MRYTIKERVIKEDITEEYHVDGVTYQANLIPHGKGGMAESFSCKNRRAIVELEGVGDVRVTFPEATLFDNGTETRPARFTPYAEEELGKAVEVLVAINEVVKEKGYSVDWLDLKIRL